MDFAALMSKEISKAKSPGASSDQKDSSKPPEKKYLRRGELEAFRIAAYNEEQERLQREREERMAKKRKAEEEEAERRHEREEKKRRLAEESRKKREEEEAAKERERRKRLGLPELPPASDKEDKEDEEEDIPEEELVEKLRDMDEPARLFGETHRGRLRRYRRLLQRSLTPQQQLTDGPIPTTLEPVPEKDMRISTTLPKDIEGRKYLFRQLASYFNMVLGEWELALAKRDVTVKQSLQGRQAYNAMVQSKENMKPLFRKFEKVDVDDSVLEHVVEIVSKAQLRRYVDANDAYLRLSIGKAYVLTRSSSSLVFEMCDN
jgi:pre-mRNA-splicing factor 18